MRRKFSNGRHIGSMEDSYRAHRILSLYSAVELVMSLNNWRLELGKQKEKWFVGSLIGFLADMAYGLAMGASLNWGLGTKQQEGRGRLKREDT